MVGRYIGGNSHDVSYFPSLAGPHKLHVFSLGFGIDIKLYGKFDLVQPFLTARTTTIELDWGMPGVLREIQLSNNMPQPLGNSSHLFGIVPTEYFFAHISGQMQFPSTEDFILHVDADPGASVVLKIDGVVVCGSQYVQAQSYFSNGNSTHFGHIVFEAHGIPRPKLDCRASLGWVEVGCRAIDLRPVYL